MLDTIEEAIEAIRNGEIIIVVDDEDRENEGDFICAAEKCTPEIINFMAKEGRGLICASLVEDRCDELELEMMVGKNTAAHETNFTVSVDLKGHGTTTGISASDRSKTIQALVDPNTKPEDLGRPGHIFPLKAKKGGVLRRAGHTEATIDFARLAGLKPAGALVEILKEDGTMARLPDLRILADKFNLKLVAIKDLIAYRMKHESLVEEEISVKLPTEWGDFQLHSFKQINTGETHLALVKGAWNEDEPVLVRVHSSCVTGDIFGSCRCDCGPQLHAAMEQVNKEGKGVHSSQEGYHRADHHETWNRSQSWHFLLELHRRERNEAKAQGQTHPQCAILGAAILPKKFEGDSEHMGLMKSQQDLMCHQMESSGALEVLVGMEYFRRKMA